MTSVTVVVPMTIRRRGGRKQIIGPDGAPVRARQDGPDVETTNGDPALVKALARAFRWRRMLEEGRYASIRELASAERVDRAYVGRLFSLSLLAPDLVEAVLDGNEPDRICLSKLTESLPPSWAMQAAVFWTRRDARTAAPTRAGSA